MREEARWYRRYGRRSCSVIRGYTSGSVSSRTKDKPEKLYTGRALAGLAGNSSTRRHDASHPAIPRVKRLA